MAGEMVDIKVRPGDSWFARVLLSYHSRPECLDSEGAHPKSSFDDKITRGDML
jgi:hypothetical protein